jgi:hypothetical protein
MSIPKKQAGQTLIALLIFILVAMTITIAAVGIAITNIKSNNSVVSGEIALQNATSGVENSLLLLERNPNYSGGTMTFDSGTATITISGSGTITIVSVGMVGNFQRTVTATVSDTGNVISLTNWSETP